MKDDSQPDSNPAQARVFIQKIEADRDRMLKNIADETRTEVEQIQTEAYRTAREFHRLKAEQTRNRCATDADRHLARATAHLRRESWRALGQLQEQAMTRVRARLDEMGEDADRQWAWCRHWLHLARTEAGEVALDITLGRDVKPEVKIRVETSLRDYAGPWRVKSDPGLGHGITVAWGDQLLDGRVQAQQPYLADEVFKRLADDLREVP